MAAPDVVQIPGLEHSTLQYGDHNLQRVVIWQDPRIDASSDTWIVYIHGGAWRDPRRVPSDFVPTIQHIQQSQDQSSWHRATTSRIRGFASIDYRLSPHPLFPQDPAATRATEYRNAKHPEHLNDVRCAIDALVSRCGVTHRYILVGHSAGATMCYQLFMTRNEAVHPVPIGIIGLAGVYDLNGLCSRKEGYEGFMRAAFGDRGEWDAASPAKFEGSFSGALVKGRHVSMVAASAGDSLVDMPELEAMYRKLSGDGVDVIAVRELTGDHDEIWGGGKEVAELVMDMLVRTSEL